MSVKKYKDFVNEKIDQYDFEFNSEISYKDVSFYNEVVDKSKDQYINAGDFKIHWEMDFHNKRSGINSMAPVIYNVSGTYMLITPAEEGPDQEDEKEFVAERDSDWEFVTEFANEYTFGSGIYINSIEIDFKTKKITVQF